MATGATPQSGIPFPEESDTPDVAADVAALAAFIDGRIFSPGDLKVSAASTATSGWLLCDGSAVSRTTYSGLFSVIGITYGSGNGSTTFNLPDFRGRSIIGAGSGVGLTARALGQTGGEETHTLLASEIAAHAHGVNDPSHAHGVADPGHAHSFLDGLHAPLTDGNGWATNYGFTQNGTSQWLVPTRFGGGTFYEATGVLGAGTGIGIYGAYTGISIQNAGGGGSHNNMQPYAVANVFVKT
jgi:microcystin-dependent protein